MYTTIVWVVRFAMFVDGVECQPDVEHFTSEAKAREWAKGPWAEGFRATDLWCEIHTVVAGPRESLL